MFKRAWLIVTAVGVVSGVGVVGYVYFAPEPSVTADLADRDLVARKPLKRGTFAGADVAHSVSGQVALHEVDGKRLLLFTGYSATAGPDVYFYLSPGGEFDVDLAERLSVPRGAGEGQANLRGNFTVALPPATRDFSEVVVWCKRFGVKFGSAQLK